jgi:hypothetical protein
MTALVVSVHGLAAAKRQQLRWCQPCRLPLRLDVVDLVDAIEEEPRHSRPLVLRIAELAQCMSPTSSVVSVDDLEPSSKRTRAVSRETVAQDHFHDVGVSGVERTDARSSAPRPVVN